MAFHFPLSYNTFTTFLQPEIPSIRETENVVGKSNNNKILMNLNLGGGGGFRVLKMAIYQIHECSAIRF